VTVALHAAAELESAGHTVSERAGRKRNERMDKPQGSLTAVP